MSHILDEETLETLTYERSKIWSNFLKSMEDVVDDEEIDMSKIEEYFNDDEEESFTENGIQEAEEDDVADDINNTTACMSNTELTQMLCNADNKEILDHTMPIVEEHVRKWKAAGLERILNTFDAEKIEQHVGDWLRRHNSAYGDKTLLDADTSPSNKTYNNRRKNVCAEELSSCSTHSEDESMHSVETARYIRASRKRTVSSSAKYSSPMTIKMYRTLPRKRAELRAKYGCDEYNDDQEHRHHMQALIRRRNQMHRRKRERDHILHTSARHYPYGMTASFNGQQRRKQLRKRRDVSPGYGISSSSEDELGHRHCDCSQCEHHAMSKSAYPYYSYQSYHSHSHSYRDYRHDKRQGMAAYGSAQRSMQSMVHCKHSTHRIHRQRAFDECPPRSRKGECGCRDRLCSMENSSTEDWLVEKTKSTNLLHMETPKGCLDPSLPSRFKSATKAKVMQDSMLGAKNRIKLFLPDNDVDEDGKPEVADTIETPEITEKEPVSKNKRCVTFSNFEVTMSKKNSNNSSKSSTENNSSKISSDKLDEAAVSSPEKQLLSEKPLNTKEKAAKTPAKKKSPTEPIKRSERLTATTRNNNKTPKKPEKPKKAAATPKVKASKKSQIDALNCTDEQMRQAMEISKETFKQQQVSKAAATPKVKASKKSQIDALNCTDEQMRQAMEISKETFKEEQARILELVKPLKKSVEATVSPQLPEQSIFNNHSVACNSTALTNDTACGKSLMATKNQMRNQCDPTEISKLDDVCDADCTLVTSTTSGEPAENRLPTAAAASITLDPPKPSYKITKNGILLHQPTDSDKIQSINSTNSNFSNFTITAEILSPIIGQNRAEKFFKHYKGKCSFDRSYYVYYRPPKRMLAAFARSSKVVDIPDSSENSDSDEDIFDLLDRYGDVRANLDKLSETD